MTTTPEEELRFLKQGLEDGVLDDLLIAQAHIERMYDLLDVGISAALHEMEVALTEEFKSVRELGELQEVLLRQHAVLTPVFATLRATYNVLCNDSTEHGGNIYQRLAELIANNPELLENKAAENSVASGDNDSTTQAKRWELNRLINQEGES